MSQTDEVKIVFTPSGRQGQVAKGTNLLQAARQLGVDVDSVCGGRAMCGRCQVNVGEGSFAKHGIDSTSANLSEPSASEARYAEKRKLAADRRLACQCSIEGDLVIDVPAESQVHNQLVRKAADNRTITLNPPVRLCFIEVREPDMHEPSGDLRRIIEALETQWADRVTGAITCDTHVLRQLRSWRKTCVSHVIAPVTRSAHCVSSASMMRRKSPDGSCISGSRTSMKHKRTGGFNVMVRLSAALRTSWL